MSASPSTKPRASLLSLVVKYRFHIVIILTQAVLLELLCVLLLIYYLYPEQSRFFYYDYGDYFDEISDEYVEKFGKNDPASVFWFDPYLGWNTGPNINGVNTHGCQGRAWKHSTDELGSRNTPGSPGGAALISLYGGSYTYGAEVDDDQTWQYFLSTLTGTKVYNFGVGGYGPDQALLKMKRNFANGIRTPIVVIGLYSAGIGRTINTYRPFLVPGAGLKLGFKPMLTDKNGRYEWLHNPLGSLDDPSTFNASFDEAKIHDHWYAQNERKPRMGFPYVFTLAKVAYYSLFEFEPKRTLWDAGHLATANVAEIIKRFVEFGRQEDFIPVLAFLPELGELDGYNEGEPPYYQEFMQLIRETYNPSELVVVDVYEARFDPYKFSPPNCHPSEYGHGIIANSVYEKIGHLIDASK